MKHLISLFLILALCHCSQMTSQTHSEESKSSMKEVRDNVVNLVKTQSKLAEGVDIENEPIKPLEMPKNLNPKKIELGELLYNDKRLSKDNSISCATCHMLDKGGVDLEPVSTGINNQKGPINAPTVFNSGFYFAQFWDGRAKDLQDQAKAPVHNPIEMGSSWQEVLGKIKDDETYKLLFSQIYPDGMTGDNIANAIAEFEMTLVTVNSRFDQYLKGNSLALTDLEKQGYELFKGYGCTTCHNGPAVGGNSFQKFGLVKDYFKTKEKITDADLGRYNVTKNEDDRHKFKVPSLRVAALTPPYFHDASSKTLDEAIRQMGRHQLGIELSDEEVTAIQAFLKSLVGEYKGQSLLKE